MYDVDAGVCSGFRVESYFSFLAGCPPDIDAHLGSYSIAVVYEGTVQVLGS